MEIHEQRHQMAAMSLQQAQEEMERIEVQYKEQTRQLNELLNSTTWRITRPLRIVVDHLNTVAGIFVKRTLYGTIVANIIVGHK